MNASTTEPHPGVGTPGEPLGETAGDPLSDCAPDDFIVRLRTIAGQVGSVNALARKAGISHSGLLRYMAGGDPSRKVLVALAQAANVDLAWLATGQGAMTGGMPKQSLTMLPRYDVSALEGAAEPVLAPSDTRTTLTELAFCRFWLQRNGLDSSHLKAIVVQGDSMAPSFVEADTVLIDVTKKEIVDGKVFLIEDCGNLLLRRVQLEVGGRVRLVSDNPAYRTSDVDLAGLAVVGRVVWSARLA